MNTYMVHMLERAREVHRANCGLTHRDSLLKCPFCVADEDEKWFRFKYEYRLHPELSRLEKPKKMPAPHCDKCPMINIIHKAFGAPGTQQQLMDDCVAVGSWLLKKLEGPADEEV